jgi:hypothetical protein
MIRSSAIVFAALTDLMKDLSVLIAVLGVFRFVLHTQFESLTGSILSRLNRSTGRWSPLQIPEMWNIYLELM